MSPFMKIRIVVAFIFLLLYGAVYLFLSHDKEQRTEQALNQQIKDLENNYEVSIGHFRLVADNLYATVINTPQVIELLYEAKHVTGMHERAQLRQTLYEVMWPHYERLHSVGVNIILFSSEDNHTFLRVHKPKKFDDDLSAVRHSFRFANADKKKVSGFEQGKISHAFRNIYPLWKGDEYLGSVDISFSSEIMQDNMTRLHGIDTHFILSKELFDVKIWQAQKQVKYIQSIEHDDYLFALTAYQSNTAFSEEKLALVKELKEQIRKEVSHGGAFALYARIDGQVKVIAFLPVLNVKDRKRVAYLVSYSESYLLQNVLRDFYWINLVLIAGFSLLAMVICNNLKHRFILQMEVEEKTKELQHLNENLQKEVEKQLAEIRNKDNLLMDQSRLAAMGEMIGNIAHQWRQPLNALGLLLQKLHLLQEREALTTDKLKENVDKGMELVETMSTTIDDFRYFLEPVKEDETFILQSVVESSISLVAGLMEQEKISLKVVTDPDITLRGCRNELSQVVLNLINNAKDALVEHPNENPLIKLHATIEGQRAVITVSDNAGGIPAKVIKKIFEPYFTTKEEGKGTGIGLFMSKRIIEEKMKGRIFVQNIEDGAQFTITLPLA